MEFASPRQGAAISPSKHPEANWQGTLTTQHFPQSAFHAQLSLFRMLYSTPTHDSN